jgi:PKD repeat protein
MKKIITSLTIIGAVIWSTAFAQNNFCGTTRVTQKYFEEHPEALQQVQQYYQGLDNSVYNGPKAVKYIPVVFHVIYNSSTNAGNASDAVIQATIAQLNLDYRKQNSDFSNTRSQFTGVAADAEIQFCLATTDPNGATTTGINRRTTNKANWSVDTETNNMKDPAGNDGGVSPWNITKYMNVWVVDLADYSPSTGGTAGYAYLPAWGSSWEAIDGIVLDYQVLGTGERTLTHEAGHYLGLPHPWEDASGNPGCTPGDGFSDTPPTNQPTYNCPATQTRCSGQLTQWENFMDYSFCPTMFSTQQSNRMNTILATTYSPGTGTPGRAGLVSWSGCNSATASLNAGFVGVPTTVVAGNSVTFTDQSAGNPTSWTWTFNGGTPSTFSGQNPPTITYNTPGVYTVTLVVSDGTNSDTQTNTNYITVTTQGGGGGTGCDSLFYFDGLYYAVDPSVDASFAIGTIENDGLTPNANNPVTSTDWGTYYDLIAPSDTDFYQLATSWFENPAVADNWIIFGPLRAGTQSSTLSWYHLIGDNDFRDGYEVLVTTAGNTLANFAGATSIASFADNDPSTDGDTVWTSQTANLPASFNGQDVYIAFHHNANDMFILALDEFLFSKCDQTQTATLDANFVGNPTTVNVGGTVNFTDLSTGNPTTWSWTFNGGTPSTFNGQNPPAITYSTVGFYTVSLTVSDGTNSNTETFAYYINVVQSSSTDTCFVRLVTDLTSYYVDPVDQASFAFNFYDQDAQTANSAIVPPFNGDWQILTSIDSVTGDTSDFLGVTSWFATTGTAADNWFTFGPLTIQNDTVRVSWWHQYLDNTYRDGYELLVTPVGPTPANFQTASVSLFNVTDNDPSTAGDTVWTPQGIVLNAAAYVGSQVYLSFHHFGNDQFVLFLDDIVVEDCDTINTVITSVNSISHDLLSIVPNPSNGDFFLNYQLITKDDMTVTVMDALGRIVYENQVGSADGGMLNLPLQGQADGIYHARIQYGNKIAVKKLVIQH